MDITKEIKTIRTEAERELGFPLVKKFWDIVEGDVGNAATDYDGDPGGQEEYRKSYRNVTGNYVTALQSILPSFKKKPSAGGNGEPTKPKVIYRKPFERRLHLVYFVWGKKGRIRARANWKQITTEWNEEHPYDQKTRAVLKAEYYRILNDDNVIRSLIALKIAPLIKEAVDKTIDFWRQHPEAKNLNELIELQEASNERSHRKEG